MEETHVWYANHIEINRTEVNPELDISDARFVNKGTCDTGTEH